MAKRGRPKKSNAEKSPVTIAYQNALKSCNSGFKHILDNYNPLTREEEKTCSSTDLVLHNFRYFFRAFKKYMVSIPIPEYCSEIFAALYDAAERFDRKKNMKFITYAQSYVNLYLLNYCRRQENIVSFNPSAINKIKTIQKFMYTFEEEHGRPYTKEDVIKKFKLTEKAYKQYMFYCNSFLNDSLDEEIYQDSDGHLGRTRADIISAKDVVNCDEESFVENYEKQELVQLVRANLKTFPEQQQIVLSKLYFGGEDPKVLAKSMNISVSRLNKIKDAALTSLRRIMVAYK